MKCEDLKCISRHCGFCQVIITLAFEGLLTLWAMLLTVLTDQWGGF